MNNSKIEWTDKTWNPITGCTQVSAGCKNCYAKKWQEDCMLWGILGILMNLMSQYTKIYLKYHCI